VFYTAARAWEMQLKTIEQAFINIFLEPIYILESLAFIFVDFWQIVGYNFVWIWEVLEGTF